MRANALYSCLFPAELSRVLAPIVSAVMLDPLKAKNATSLMFKMFTVFVRT